jgi:hypothetical protein
MPSRNGTNGNGRGPDGRFVTGNCGGPGAPLSGKIAKLRAALVSAVEPADFIAIGKVLIRQARGGNLDAARVLFDRVLGKPLEADLLERLEHLELEVASGPA